RGLQHGDGLVAIDRRLHALSRERGQLRAVLARIAWRLVIVRAWERIGYARLSDYAVERLGLSARWVQGLAQVGEGFRVFPGLEEALVSGALGWTKVRLLASLPPTDEDEQASWLARARRLTAEQLSKQVRAVDRASIDAADASEATGHSRVFEARCSPDVRWKWYAARGAASRAAGRMLHVAEAAELIAAEVLSALPLDEDEDADQQACDEVGVSWSPEPEEEAGGSEVFGTGSHPCPRPRAPRARGRPERAVRPRLQVGRVVLGEGGRPGAAGRLRSARAFRGGLGGLGAARDRAAAPRRRGVGARPRGDRP